MSSKLRRPALQALLVFLWIVVAWLGYATFDGFISFQRDSTAGYADARSRMAFDVIVTMIFTGLALSFLFAIRKLRISLAELKELEHRK